MESIICPENDILLKMVHIDKKFPGVHALRDVSLELRKGEVHALLGENGAGKSTLINVLGGVISPNAGEIYINGKKMSIGSVIDAQRAGIAVIHQELVLVPYMTIAENIFMGREPKNNLVIDRKKMNREAAEILGRIGLNLNPATPVRNLSIAQQQMVEIAKALSLKSNILVMDEPTSSLSENEVNVLFQIIRKLKTEGVGIIYVSHRMSELFEITDRITVMRDGEYIDTRNTNETNTDELVYLMVGRKLENYYTRNFREPGAVTLKVAKMSVRNLLHEISFEAREGEIVGFSGLIGAGRSELMQAIVGLRKYQSGEVTICGKAQNNEGYRKAISKGIVLVPEDRKKLGLILINTVAFNSTLAVVHEFIKKGWVNRKKEKEIVDNAVKGLRIKASSHEQRVGTLSGGNQQKVLIGKWLATNPKILILDEPTRGVDVGAKADIYEIMDNLAAQGITIIMVSSDMTEIMNMCDRVIVMKNGAITGTVEHEELSQERIMHLATYEGEGE